MEAVEKQRTSLYVGGKEYVVVSADSRQYLQRVAAYADRALRETALATRLPPVQVGALTAINLSDELLKAQDENTRLRRENRELHQKLEQLQGGEDA